MSPLGCSSENFVFKMQNDVSSNSNDCISTKFNSLDLGHHVLGLILLTVISFLCTVCTDACIHNLIASDFEFATTPWIIFPFI